MRQIFLFSFRLLRREWRAGELRVLVLALVIAVASISAVGFATDRVELALQYQANELLGADLLIVSDHPVDHQFRQLADEYKLRSAETTSFVSMLLAGDKNQLAEVKAVSAGYPLRGQLRIAEQQFGPEAPVTGIPAPGTAWADSRLLTQLSVKVGDTIKLGDSQLKISALLVHEPDRGGDLFSIAPRLLMNLHDVPATKLIQTGSRVRYRLLLSGEVDGITRYRERISPSLAPGEKLEGVSDARPEVRAALERAQRFLGLAALVSVLLAGAAIATAARRFSLRHLDSCALLRCLGARQSFITWIYLTQLIILGLVAGIIGCAAGYAAHNALTNLLGGIVAAELPPPSWRPVGFGLLTGMVALLGFAAPPLLALKNVPTLRVLRREIGLPVRGASVYGIGWVVFAALMVWQAGNVKLGLYLVLGTVATLAFLGAVAWLLVRLLGQLRERVGVAWRFGLANIARRPANSVTQILAFGIGLMALLLLTLVRADLLASWQGSLPRDAPNRFIINIQPEQLSALRRFFADEGMPAIQLYPMVRGRLVKINDKAVTPNDYQDQRAASLVEREFNLSSIEALPDDNQITSGRWWRPDDSGKNLYSVEQGIAETLGIKLGDRLTYLIAGEEFAGKVASLRKVDWDSFRVNFFVIATPGSLSPYPTSYITSFYLSAERTEVLSRLVKTFPNITVIDVAAIMAQVRSIIERVTLAVEYVFAFTLLAGLTVLYAAIQATQDERLHDSAMLRTLGASRRQIVSGLLAEFITLGVLAGLVAALAASVLAYVLAEYVLHLPYIFNGWVWLMGITAGGIGVGIAGTLGLLSVLRQPPLFSLREA